MINRRRVVMSVARFFRNVKISGEILVQGAASLIVGSILLLSIYLFLTQLAEHGW